MEITGVDHRFGACCNNNNFLGSSRTYIFLANSLDIDSNIGAAPTPTMAKFKPDLRCLNAADYIYGPDYMDWKDSGDNSYINSIIVSKSVENGKEGDIVESSCFIGSPDGSGGLAFQDRIEYKFEQGHTSEYMSHYAGFGVNAFGSPLAWQDDGRINGILSPLFVAGWINCFGQPCYDCYWQAAVKCGSGPELMMNNLSELIDKYFEELEYRPYEGFYEDWHGVISRGAEPITGWYLYVFFGFSIACGLCGYYDEYCGCCWFCFQKDCIEPFFIRKITGSSILTLNRKRGIPFLNSDKLLDFYNKTLSFNISNIELYDMSDEIVFLAGSADWKNGDISYSRYHAPSTGYFEGSGTYFNENRMATIYDARDVFSGFGSGRNIIIYGNNYPVQISRNGGGILTRDTFVINKKEDNELSGSLLFDCGWIYVDIPPFIVPEISYIINTADAGNLPDLAYGGGVAWNPVAAFPWLNKRHKKLYVRTIKNDGNFAKFSEGDGETFYFKGFSDPGLPSPEPEAGDDALLIRYFKQCRKKIIKAPYNLYFKSGENIFRKCLLGETLKDLSPGRYYFPNPAVANRQLAMFDPDFEDLYINGEVIDKSFYNNFNTNYRQFNLNYNRSYRANQLKDLISDMNLNKNDLTRKLENAIFILGHPFLSGKNSVRMEYGGEFDSSFDIYSAINFAENTNLAFSEALEAYLSIQI